MDVYVYGDESGVFDPDHGYEYYVFGGLIFAGREEKDSQLRKYLAAERRIAPQYPRGMELKAANVTLKHKMSLFRATNGCRRFIGVVDQGRVYRRILSSKKSKQRYLDFAFKMTLKKSLAQMMYEPAFRGEDLCDLIVRFDEHKTATNGKYELRESISAEFKDGLIAPDGRFIEPAYPNMGEVKVSFVDSEKDPLVRASDVIANVALHKALESDFSTLRKKSYLTLLP